MKKTKVAVIGSGRISEEYLRNMSLSFANLESAKKRAAQCGIEV